MKTIHMNEDEHSTVKSAVKYVAHWAREHQAELGLAEIALGGSLLALGIQNGAIEMGKQLIGTATSDFNLASEIGAALGGTTGAVSGYLIGSIGIVAAGGGIGIPVLVLAGGATLLLGAAGYAAGDLVHNFLNPPIGMRQLIGNASLLVVGVALVVDGARRIAKDPRVRAKAAFVRAGVIHLYQLNVETVIRSRARLDEIRQRLMSRPDLVANAATGICVATAGALGGAAAGSAIAAGSVTVLGSSSLGAAALSLGLVSAPIWPVIALGTAGLGVGYAAWKTGHALVRRKARQQTSSTLLLTSSTPVSDEDQETT